jgi:hypothetical protein
MKQYLPLLAVLLLPACTSHLQQKENFLREAGFHAITPHTPAQIARANALPQGHIRQIKRDGKTLFVLADTRKNLVLVGGNPQYERYQQILYSKVVDPAIAGEKADKEFEEDGGWDGMLDPFFFGGPMMWY